MHLRLIHATPSCKGALFGGHLRFSDKHAPTSGPALIHTNLPHTPAGDDYRSPVLACTFGACITLRYIATLSEDVVVWDEDEGTVRDNGFLDLVGFPLTVICLIAMVMTAVRLLVMYYPKKRAKWGRYIKEKPLVWVLGFALVFMEVVVWYAAWTQGVMR